jgi:hypothetical protein
MTGSTGFTGTIDNISVKEVLTPNLLLTSAGDDDSTFDTDTGNWIKEAGWSITGGKAEASSAGSGVNLRINLGEPNKHYAITFYVEALSSGGLIPIVGGVGSGTVITTTGWHTQYIRCGSSLAYTGLKASGVTTATIDNVIVQEVPASVARAFYLDFDGVDDNLILPGTDFGSSTNATLYKTFRGDSTDTKQVMFGTGVGPYVLAAVSGSATTPVSGTVGSPVYREDGVIPSYATEGDVFTALVDNTDHTLGVEEVDLSASARWASSGFYIGGEYNTTYDSTGRLYSWAAVDTRLDGRNRDLLENFMISRKTA